ncbi:hypothetical protein FQN49_008019 [Arthroderma sp. PD_2]|nr:hypothetical protein FQN49_008019 [Arthroderma sp. PD_2]
MAPFENQKPSYNVTEYGPGAVPAALYNTECSSLYIEFLRMNADGHTPQEAAKLKNHAIFKADFPRRTENCDGVRLSMEVDFGLGSNTSDGGSSRKPGELLIEPVRYEGRSFSSACTVNIPLRQRITLGHLIHAIAANNLQHFYFCTVNQKYYGCRDFVAQATAQLFRYGYIGLDIVSHSPSQVVLPSRNIYHLLGLRFPPMGNPTVCPIDKGWFNGYSRVVVGEMRYKA